MDNTIVSPAEYFEQVKSRKQTMTAAGLSQLYENCLALLEEYQRSGQIAAQKKLLFHIDNITREKKLLDLGIDTFVYKSDVDDFIHMVDNKVVKIVELENYQRRIPEEIIQRIVYLQTLPTGIGSKHCLLFASCIGKNISCLVSS